MVTDLALRARSCVHGDGDGSRRSFSKLGRLSGMRNRALLSASLFLMLSACAKDRAPVASSTESTFGKEADFTAAKGAASAAPPSVGGGGRGEGVALDGVDD